MGSFAFKELTSIIGLDTIIFSRKTAWRQAVLVMIAGRVVYQGSKLGLSNRYMDTCPTRASGSRPNAWH